MPMHSDTQFDDLMKSNQRLVASVESLVRAIHGAPDEGNPGMLPRLQKIEKDHMKFRWSIPFALVGGTSFATVLTRWLGI